MVQIYPDEGTVRKGLDLFSEVRVDVLTALLGGSLCVTTLRGERALQLPAGVTTAQHSAA